MSTALVETPAPPENGRAVVESLNVRPGGWNAVRNLSEAVQVGEVLFRSNLGNLRNAQQAVVKILAGMELGFGPLASMMNIHLIPSPSGLMPSIGAHLRAAAIKASDKYDYELVANSAQVCEIAVYERQLASGGEMRKRTSGWIKKPHVLKLTIEEVQKLGWTMSAKGNQKENWTNDPAGMLFARLISRAQRQHCPDLTGGMLLYDPDEIESVPENATVQQETQVSQVVIDTPFEPVTPATISIPSAPAVLPEAAPEPTRQKVAPASRHQVERIDELLTALGRSRTDMDATWRYFNVSGPELLDVEQAASLIRKLEKQPAMAG